MSLLPQGCTSSSRKQCSTDWYSIGDQARTDSGHCLSLCTDHSNWHPAGVSILRLADLWLVRLHSRSMSVTQILFGPSVAGAGGAIRPHPRLKTPDPEEASHS